MFDGEFPMIGRIIRRIFQPLEKKEARDEKTKLDFGSGVVRYF